MSDHHDEDKDIDLFDDLWNKVEVLTKIHSKEAVGSMMIGQGLRLLKSIFTQEEFDHFMTLLNETATQIDPNGEFITNWNIKGEDDDPTFH